MSLRAPIGGSDQLRNSLTLLFYTNGSFTCRRSHQMTGLVKKGWVRRQFSSGCDGSGLNQPTADESVKASPLHDPTEYVPQAPFGHLEGGLLLLVLDVNAGTVFHQQLGCLHALLITRKMAVKEKGKKKTFMVLKSLNTIWCWFWFQFFSFLQIPQSSNKKLKKTWWRIESKHSQIIWLNCVTKGKCKSSHHVMASTFN